MIDFTRPLTPGPGTPYHTPRSQQVGYHWPPRTTNNTPPCASPPAHQVDTSALTTRTCSHQTQLPNLHTAASKSAITGPVYTTSTCRCPGITPAASHQVDTWALVAPAHHPLFQRPSDPTNPHSQ